MGGGLLYDREIGARSVISGLPGVARGALWVALVFAAFFLADSLLFRTGWYGQFLEPDSSAGSLEAQLHWLAATPAGKTPEVLAIGDSRVAEGFSSRIADSATHRRLRFWNFGLGGTTPRVWYYTLRAADPTRRRFAAIAIALDDYSDADWFAEFEDRDGDQKYLVMRLGLGDCLDFAMSMHSMEIRHRAFFGCLFRGMILRNDVQGFLAHLQTRIARAADKLENGLEYSNGYGGMTQNMSGLAVDWQRRTIRFPDGLSEDRRANVQRFVVREPVQQTGALARYRRRWLNGILDLYKDSPTRLIFLQLPRAPLVDPVANVPSNAKRFVDSLGGMPRVTVLPAETFTDLEQPAMFGDGLHLNHDGRGVFSLRLAELLDATVAGKGGEGR